MICIGIWMLEIKVLIVMFEEVLSTVCVFSWVVNGGWSLVQFVEKLEMWFLSLCLAVKFSFLMTRMGCIGIWMLEIKLLLVLFEETLSTVSVFAWVVNGGWSLGQFVAKLEMWFLKSFLGSKIFIVPFEQADWLLTCQDGTHFFA